MDFETYNFLNPHISVKDKWLQKSQIIKKNKKIQMMKKYPKQVYLKIGFFHHKCKYLQILNFVI